MANRLSQKHAGAYYTPDNVARALVRWVVRNEGDRLLDPSCGDGRFLAAHRNSLGVEQDIRAAHVAMKRAPSAEIHENDFFSWAAETEDRFECAVGNPPFIRYQLFAGETRETAFRLCKQLGADFSGLASSWAPFLVATAGLLRRGGRMAFVVPAEIGHAPYSAPLLEYLLSHFEVVHIVAIQEKLFPELSEDCWLLYVDGFGSHTNVIRFSSIQRFKSPTQPPRQFTNVPASEWRDSWGRRLRPYLISEMARNVYREIVERHDTQRLGDLASIGIGYVSGANDFFHLRPSEVAGWGIPASFLQPTVRNGRALSDRFLTFDHVERWKRNNEPILLLRLPKSNNLPEPVRKYLDTEQGLQAREAYKCRTRDPWYSVPDVQVPHFFLSYMCGVQPNLVRNDAQCSCTNSLHSVRLKAGVNASALEAWGSQFVRLSCELEGHPLGGGLLKLEPREAARVALPNVAVLSDQSLFQEATGSLRAWRHYASAA